MNMAAFVSLEDISDALPPYAEEVIAVDMDAELKKAYSDLENDIRDALREHHGNASVISTAMNALLLYPDRPFGLGTLYGFYTNPESGERERFVIADPPDLDEQFSYAKERRLLEEIRQELTRGRGTLGSARRSCYHGDGKTPPPSAAARAVRAPVMIRSGVQTQPGVADQQTPIRQCAGWEVIGGRIRRAWLKSQPFQRCGIATIPASAHRICRPGAKPAPPQQVHGFIALLITHVPREDQHGIRRHGDERRSRQTIQAWTIGLNRASIARGGRVDPVLVDIAIEDLNP